jgi:processive 1,2-diacylglycerol beta-glucosyltransferase
MKIHLLYEHSGDKIPHGCSYIRLLLPFQHSSVKNYINLTSGISIDGTEADIYIIERLWRPGLSILEAEEVIHFIKKRGSKLIYTIDDNLLDLNIINLDGTSFPDVNQKNIIRTFVKEADGVIVSTEPLRQRLLHLNSKIIVVPNHLDEQLLHYPSTIENSSDIVKIGYMGTPSHESDLMMILPALREILHKYRDCVKLQLVGVLDNNKISKLFEGLPVESMNTEGNIEYLKFMKWLSSNTKWDFGIAPLENNKFSMSKSDIKFLDYGILRLPGIFSKVDPYLGTVRHLENGYLVENNQEDWYEGLETMIKDHQLRKVLGDNAFAYVRGNRVLKDRAIDWIGAIESLIDIQFPKRND